MVILLDGKAFEAALPDMAVAAVVPAIVTQLVSHHCMKELNAPSGRGL